MKAEWRIQGPNIGIVLIGIATLVEGAIQVASLGVVSPDLALQVALRRASWRRRRGLAKR